MSGISASKTTALETYGRSDASTVCSRQHRDFKKTKREEIMSKRDETSEKKEYSSPRIIHTEKIEARAVACVRSTDVTCGAGPINS